MRERLERGAVPRAPGPESGSASASASATGAADDDASPSEPESSLSAGGADHEWPGREGGVGGWEAAADGANPTTGREPWPGPNHPN